MERAGEIVKIEGEPVRLMRKRGAFDQPRILRQLPEQGDLARVGKAGGGTLQFRAVETLRGLLSDPKPETTHG